MNHILFDTGSVVNLMPIKLLKAIGVNLKKADGIVISTDTNAPARIAYYADLTIRVAGVHCGLRVYTLLAKYRPNYPVL